MVVVFLTQSIVLGRVVREQLDRLATARTDNVQWNLAQIEVDLLQLQLAMERANVEGIPALREMRKRFDIFYSRHAIISQSPIYAELRENARNKVRLRYFKAYLDQAIPLVDGPDEILLTRMDDLLAASDILHRDVRALALEGVSIFAQTDERTRGEMSSTLIKLGLSTLALIAALSGTAVILLRMYRRGKIAAEENEVMRNRFEAMVSSSLDAILVIDPKGQIIAFNGAATEVFGYEREEAMGQNMADLIVPEHLREAHTKGMQRYLTTGEKRVIGAGRVRLEALHKSGRIFPVELSISAAEHQNRTVLVSFLRDISKQVEDEAELVRARDEAQAGEQAKAELLTVMSHEMRTPLNGILGSLDLIDRGNLSADQMRYLEAIKVSGDLLLGHVNDVLDVSRLDAMDDAPQTAPFELSKMAQALLDSLLANAKTRGNSLNLSLCSDDLTTVSGDELRLKQCLLNLLGNANKFTTNGEISLEIERQKSNPDIVEFRVSDTGIGIAEADLERIFEDFVKIDSGYARRDSGTGLGLAITKRLVTGMGGSIFADSFEGEGSLFTMQIPLPLVEAGAHATPEINAKSDITAITCLVVDDNSINRMIAADMLRSRGVEVFEATGGLDAIEQSQKRAFELILMDISMPEVDGLEALARIRAGDGPNKETRIVALTAHAAPEDKERILAAGFESVITKPLTQRAIAKLIVASATSEEEKAGPDEIIALLGQERYDAALDEFKGDLRAFEARISDAHSPSEDLAQEAHMLVGAASVLGLGNQWECLRQVERAKEPDWTTAKAEALAAIRNADL
ncbi:PAS/PAC sensor hybrid histidine kinase [Shimia isoporae]|uniref:histidine kinase n=1 Tax=Shimia isoporae TaxID=647720 RepID=A0A4R1NX93_9RHOB|nr:PAS domain-containing hybrid sensor histidine kinase/response regulator [Shimia isoporae]TCL09888.1 PAS/PAC sensor hybrid histidine kinase [Shimia isoporae]